MAKSCNKTTEINIFVRCAVAVFVVASIFSAIGLLMRYNDYRNKIDELEIKRSEYAERIERIEYELGCEFDDEYVIRIAKEKLNLCMPSEAVYYNGLE
ncbi:MAG: hypothetical protein U0M06_14190 [Clostridia bacterium]|nr:hypothetical protein [Clostridia bacterium]